jgi:hypothetical protein
MLPHLTKTLAAAAIAFAATQASPAQAWGKPEQDVLTGILGTLAIQSLIRHDEAHRQPQAAPPPRYEEVPVYAPARPVAVSRTAAARAYNSYSRAERVAIQKRLRAYGYYRGSADGVFGPGTYSAVTAYARDEGLSGNLQSTSGAFGVYDSLIY